MIEFDLDEWSGVATCLQLVQHVHGVPRLGCWRTGIVADRAQALRKLATRTRC